MEPMELIRKCREYAHHKGLSLSEVAEQAGVSKGLVGHWFNERRIPSTQKLFALVNAVGLQLQIAESTEPAKKEETRPMLELPQFIQNAARDLALPLDKLTNERVEAASAAALKGASSKIERGKIESTARMLLQWIKVAEVTG